MRNLLSTVSYPVMNLVLNIAINEKAKQKKGYDEHMVRLQNNRYKAIMRGRPFQPVFG